MKILVNRAPIYDRPWGGGIQFVNNFHDYFRKKGHTVINRFEDNINIILMIDPRPDELGIGYEEIIKYLGTDQAKLYKKHNYNDYDSYIKDKSRVKLIHRVNECSLRKKNDPNDEMDLLLYRCSLFNDVSCFIGNWIKEYHTDSTHNDWISQDNNLVIHSGCNQDWFKPNKKYSDVDGKIHIISHHWSDNSLKEQGLNQWLDEFVGRNKDFTFTYIGRTNVRFKNSKHIQPLFGQALGDELGKYDLCINKSFADPFPNSCIEVLSCKIPLYAHVGGGGAREAAGEDHIFDTFEDLEKILLSKNYTMNTSFVPYSWEECMKKYENVINELMEK